MACYGIRGREIIFEVVEPMTTDHQRHRQPERQTDRRMDDFPWWFRSAI